MSTGLKANNDGSAAIQVGGTDYLTVTSGGAVTIPGTFAVTGATTVQATLAVTGATTIQAGTAAAPAITFTGDTNTGIYSPGADRIGFTTGGTQRGEFDSSGNFLFNSGFGSVATAFGCRAWVNFNGASANPITPTGSGNVSSVSKTSTGVFTVNLTTAMPDTNFAFTATTRTSNTIAQGRSTATTTSTIPIGTATASGAGVIDTVTHVAVFR